MRGVMERGAGGAVSWEYGQWSMGVGLKILQMVSVGK